MKINNPLEGSWKVECQVATDDRRWEIYPQFCSGECTWTFQTEGSYSYDDPDEQTYHGKITEHLHNDAVIAHYCYLAYACRLFIERPFFNDDGRLWSCQSDILSVAKEASEELILHKLRNEKDDACSNNYRLRLKKLP